MDNSNCICFVSQFPPPIHGLSKAVETLYYSALNKEVNENARYSFEKINITNNKNFLKTIYRILRSKAHVYYFTISQTRGGNIRDLVILFLMTNKGKTIIHLHGGYYRRLVDNDMGCIQRKLNYLFLSRVEGAIVLSASLKPIFTGMVPAKRIYTVSNCVDDEILMTKDELDNKLEKTQKREVLHILWLSNFIRSKGYPIVLELANLEKKRVDNGGRRRFVFDFAGEFFREDERQYFKRLVKEYNIGDYITEHGRVIGEKKYELLKECDIFVLPTRYPNEGQPISILEAMGNGMMIVTTKHAGIPDIVTDGVNGIVAEENMNVQDVYNRMLNEFSVTYGRNNYEKIIQNYRQEKYICNMDNVFRSVIDES